ncbi:MAG: tRNA (N(6)-L-threonylcarbamoyladenosine(37)-C(2))-methylthiotransferase MtaB [Pseudomonadota bacterium]
MTKKIFEITTLGCKVNQFESALVSAKLAASGYGEKGCAGSESAPDACPDETTLCIINTCTVTEKASMQSRQAIRQAIRNHPRARIVVTGCYAQTQPEEIRKIKGVHDIIGHGEKHCIPERLLSDAGPPCPLSTANTSPWYEGDTGLITIPAFTNRTRAFLKIQDGCDARCTYCIVPHARGNSRSMPFQQVLNHLFQLETAGHSEVVLSGIHLGAYGKDLSPTHGLPALLADIEASEIKARIRLSSIEPRELTDEIIAIAAHSEKICPHFHIPLQSGDDTILRRMGRPYAGSFFRDRVSTIHEQMPDAAIGVDTLIGFPGESQEAFENTYNLISSLPITYLHVFPFSPRDQTPAAEFENRVPPDIVKSRCREMRALNSSKKRHFYQRFIGKTARVLIEGGRDPNTGYLKGITSNYIPVFLTGDEGLKNTLVWTVLEKPAGDRGVIGTVVNSDGVHP